jgi:predicted dehydrogenase
VALGERRSVAPRFGVCGTAFWAEHVHLPGLKANDEVELVGVWGRNPDRAHALATTFSIRSFASFDELLENVDAVSFAVPPAVQAELAPKVADAGRHLLLEKPVAPSLREAETIAQAVNDAGVAALCFLTRMFVADIQAFIESAKAAGSAGGKASFRSNALIAGPYADSAWRRTEHGALWDAAPHGMSVLASVLGPIAEVRAIAAEDGRYDLDFGHVRGGRSSLELNLRDLTVKLAESYCFFGEGHRVVELSNLPYDRQATFTAAARTLLNLIQRGCARDRTNLGFATHLVAVTEAAERSLRTGGSLETVASTTLDQV